MKNCEINERLFFIFFPSLKGEMKDCEINERLLFIFSPALKGEMKNYEIHKRLFFIFFPSLKGEMKNYEIHKTFPFTNNLAPYKIRITNPSGHEGSWAPFRAGENQEPKCNFIYQDVFHFLPLPKG